MVTTTPYRQNGQPGFIGDVLTREHVLPGGARLDAAQFTGADAVKVAVGVAGAAQGATSLPVTTLPDAVPAGALLNFGARSAQSVVVGAAGAAADATSVPVDALTAALANGTVLDFGGQKFARLTAAATAGATSLTVAALPKALVDNDTATVPGVSARTAKVTAAAAAGATSLSVEALPEALVSGDVAYYALAGTGRRIVAGTLVGCTHAELEAAPALTGGVPAGLLWGAAADADDIVRLTAYEITDADKNADVDLLRPGTLVFVNHLPGWSTLSSALKAKVRATYECSVAV